MYFNIFNQKDTKNTNVEQITKMAIAEKENIKRQIQGHCRNKQ